MITVILDRYIKRPLLYDLIIILVILGVLYLILNKLEVDVTSSKDDIKSTITDVIGTSISLAGFVLASLTIIVTFKDNITHKEISAPSQNPQTSIGLLLSSKHYKTIVGIFTWAAFIFLGLFLLISVVKAFASHIEAKALFYLSLWAVLLTAFTIFRSLLVLYNVIQLQLKK